MVAEGLRQKQLKYKISNMDNSGGEALAQAARGGGALSLQTAKVRLDEL